VLLRKRNGKVTSIVVATTTMKVVPLTSPVNSRRTAPANWIARAKGPLAGRTVGRETAMGGAGSTSAGVCFRTRPLRSSNLNREYAISQAAAPTASHSSRFQSSIPVKPSDSEFLSATVQYFVITSNVRMPKGSRSMAAVRWSRSETSIRDTT
jgi:hypothetical protein